MPVSLQVKGSCSTNLEITFEGLRYHFDVTRTLDILIFRIEPEDGWAKKGCLGVNLVVFLGGV